MKKVIVTGGNGFIGSNLIIFLIKKNILLLILIKINTQKNLTYLKISIKKIISFLSWI